MSVSLSEALLLALREQGASEVFGIPGDFVIPFFKVIEQKEILPLYTLSHEPAVAFAADAAARVKGGLGVAVMTYGPGALNAVNAVANAYTEKSPLVIISGGPARSEIYSGFLVHHQARTFESQLLMYREISCDQARLDDIERAPEIISRVLRSAREQSQPVYLEIPRDMALWPCRRVKTLEPRSSNRLAVQECAAEIMLRLRAAKRPALLVGVEVRRYGLSHKVADLARRLSLPIATTLMGRGLFAGVEASVSGTYLGQAGDPGVSRMVEESDALLMLGPVFSDTNFGVSTKVLDPRRVLLAAGRQVRIGHHVYPDIVLAELLEALLELAAAPATLRAAPASVREPVEYPRGLPLDESPITPIDVACAVNDLIADEGPIAMTCDMGDCLFVAMSIEHDAFLASACYATMGFAVPAALGVQAASRQRPLVLLGDGAFQMTGMELGNCQRYGWNPLVLLLNNGGWGMLQAFDAETRFNRLSDWRYAELARALGGRGYKVQTRRELGQVLRREWRQSGDFCLIEIAIAAGQKSPTLDRYVRVFEERRKRQRTMSA